MRYFINFMIYNIIKQKISKKKKVVKGIKSDKRLNKERKRRRKEYRYIKASIFC